MVRARTQEGEMNMYAHLQNNNHVLIANEESTRGKTPIISIKDRSTNYNQTFY